MCNAWWQKQIHNACFHSTNTLIKWWINDEKGNTAHVRFWNNEPVKYEIYDYKRDVQCVSTHKKLPQSNLWCMITHAYAQCMIVTRNKIPIECVLQDGEMTCTMCKHATKTPTSDVQSLMVQWNVQLATTLQKYIDQRCSAWIAQGMIAIKTTLLECGINDFQRKIAMFAYFQTNVTIRCEIHDGKRKFTIYNCYW